MTPTNPSKSERQWRACARDEGDTGMDCTHWCSEERARDFHRRNQESDPPYDESWLETREVLYGEPERVS